MMYLADNICREASALFRVPVGLENLQTSWNIKVFIIIGWFVQLYKDKHLWVMHICPDNHEVCNSGSLEYTSTAYDIRRFHFSTGGRTSPISGTR